MIGLALAICIAAFCLAGVSYAASAEARVWLIVDCYYCLDVYGNYGSPDYVCEFYDVDEDGVFDPDDGDTITCNCRSVCIPRPSPPGQ